MVDLIGRGTGKSPIQAVRAHYAATTMPRASGAFIGPSYVNIMERTLPPVERFWQEFFKWEEGKHYVMFKKPPAHWPKPLTPPSSYKHVITIYTGFIFYLGSLDRPGILNSLSLQYYTLDEGRFANYERLTKDLMPAVRGDIQRFGKNPLYLGRTITSDLPFIEDNAEWLYGLEKRMKPENVKLIELFETKISVLKKKLLETTEVLKQERLKKRIKKITGFANIVRRKTTYFVKASSLANRFVLGLDYFRNNSDPTVNPKHVFRTSYLSIKPRSVESMFYGKMLPKHWYTGKFNYTILDKLYSKYGNRSAAKRTCSSDDDLDRQKGLICGVDFGNMVSMSIGQKNPFGLNEFRTVKFLHTLVPKDMDDLADIFTTYYAAYPEKKLRMHYDRTGNVKLENSKKTKAQHFADRVRSKGWEVELMSKGMGNIPHPLKHILFSRMFSEEDLEKYPVLRSNRDNCIELHSSMNLAPAINKTGEIFKDKKSEGLRPITRLPMESTNPSDSWDYMIWGEYRHTIVKTSKGSGYTRQKKTA